MYVLGDDVYIQRGENWSLDFQVTNTKGEPYMLFKKWRHPYLAITVTAARYSQKGDYRHTWWLDLEQRYVENNSGELVLSPMKKFISTEALYIEGSDFSAQEVISTYGVDAGGRIVLDETSDFDITNYLFYIDPDNDGNRVYKYLLSYDVSDGAITNETWSDPYDFRIIKSFDTKEWVEQGYLFDIKVLTGDTIEESMHDYMLEEDYTGVPDLPWDDLTTEIQLERIVDTDTYEMYKNLLNSGMPLMPDYDTKLLVLHPTNLFVSANIQSGD